MYSRNIRRLVKITFRDGVELFVKPITQREGAPSRKVAAVTPQTMPVVVCEDDGFREGLNPSY